jgi:hypothetical protein
MSLRDSLASIGGALIRGRRHFERVHEADRRVVVSGVRGKSTLVRWLHDALTAQGIDTFGKVTGDHPYVLADGQRHAVDRDGITRLYENERLYAEYGPAEAVVAENQGIREYTTRLASERWDPHVVVLLNVRRDHLGTLGDDLDETARAFARTVPDGRHVICGDRNEAIVEYLQEQLQPRGVDFTHVDPPEKYDVLGARTAFAIDPVLRELGCEPMGQDHAIELLSALRSSWTWRRLEGGGLACNAASLNDIESTEHLRRHLVEALDDPTIEPVCYLRRDRPGRTASYIRYAEWLHEHGFTERFHVAGGHSDLFRRRADVPVISHNEASKTATEVLDSVLADGRPVMFMANTVAPLMREMEAELEARTVGRHTADDWEFTNAT